MLLLVLWAPGKNESTCTTWAFQRSRPPVLVTHGLPEVTAVLKKSFPSSRILYICAMSVEDCWYVLQYKVVNQFLKYNLRLGSVKVLSSDSCIYRSIWIVCNCSLKIQISEDIVTRHTCQTLLSMCMSVNAVHVSPCQSSQSVLCLYCWQTDL